MKIDVYVVCIWFFDFRGGEVSKRVTGNSRCTVNMLILRYYLLVIGDPNLNGCPDFSQCNSPATKSELVTYTSL